MGMNVATRRLEKQGVVVDMLESDGQMNIRKIPTDARSPHLKRTAGAGARPRLTSGKYVQHKNRLWVVMPPRQ